MNDATTSPRGQVITFYSYKGGTGRTMALANVGCILARRQVARSGKGVLMIDWDLEAPGLHRFFEEKTTASAASRLATATGTPVPLGVIDLAYDLQSKVEYEQEKLASIAPAGDAATDREALARGVIASVTLTNYIRDTSVPGLQLIRAGLSDGQSAEAYAERVSKFDWETLYERLPAVFRVLADRLAHEYAYVLIDSRTGITDTSGICTMLLPEKLVVVFTPNTQSLRGGMDLVRRATEYRANSGDLRSLCVFPLISRVEANEPHLRKLWRFGDASERVDGYQPSFEAVLGAAYSKGHIDLNDYFDEVQIQQVPTYAYGEQVAALLERTSDRFSLSRSYQAFAVRLADSRVPWDESGRDVADLPALRDVPFDAASLRPAVTPELEDDGFPATLRAGGTTQVATRRVAILALVAFLGCVWLGVSLFRTDAARYLAAANRDLALARGRELEARLESVESDKTRMTREVEKVLFDCEQGEFAACHVAGVAYYSGLGLEEDLDQARIAFSRACDEGGIDESCEYLARLGRASAEPPREPEPVPEEPEVPGPANAPLLPAPEVEQVEEQLPKRYCTVGVRNADLIEACDANTRSACVDRARCIVRPRQVFCFAYESVQRGRELRCARTVAACEVARASAGVAVTKECGSFPLRSLPEATCTGRAGWVYVGEFEDGDWVEEMFKDLPETPASLKARQTLHTRTALSVRSDPNGTYKRFIPTGDPVCFLELADEPFGPNLIWARVSTH